MNNLGKRIKLARAYRNYSQEYMAEELGVDQSTYSRIESGSITPNIARLRHIADLLKVKVDYLIDEGDLLLFTGQEPM